MEHQRMGRDLLEQPGLEALQGLYPSSALVFITNGRTPRPAPDGIGGEHDQ